MIGALRRGGGTLLRVAVASCGITTARESQMAARFKDKVVVVLGGNSGIGLASAQAFAAEGARVVITGRDPNTLRDAAERIGHDVLAARADISSLPQSRALFSELQRAVQRIDVLFVNAGVLALMPIEAVSESIWSTVHDSNLKGAFFSVQAALPLMSSGGSIVLNSSVATSKGDAGVLVYATSKAGLRALGRSLAGELAGRGIRVNVISPGVIQTPIFHRAERTPPLGDEAVAEQLRQVRARIPLGRLGTPEEVAAAVLFLASDEAAYITGVDLPIDGGVANI